MQNRKFPEVIKDDYIVNSAFLNGLSISDAKEKAIEEIEKNGKGKRKITYKLRDWIFSRQRYWGEPIPMINCEKCGWISEKEENLPIKLPQVQDYRPTENGESPLAKSLNWINVKCSKCGNDAKRETDTMPNWAGSSWYFLRYIDPNNDKEFASQEKLKYWLPIDWYNGGMEHTTLHLLYSRFWHKFLYNCGYVPTKEPYQKRTSHGMILGEDGSKMSKSKGNVINPDIIIQEFGVDTLRMYEMFIGPFDQPASWNVDSVKGVHRFLLRVWKTLQNIDINNNIQITKIDISMMNKIIKEITEKIDKMQFNTAVSSLMIYTNYLIERKIIPFDMEKILIQLIAPFAPHVAEEMWEKLHNIFNIKTENLVCQEKWPIYDINLIHNDVIIISIQVNGKLKGTIEVDKNTSEEDSIKLAKNINLVKKYLDNVNIKKTIYIAGKIINFVI